MTNLDASAASRRPAEPARTRGPRIALISGTVLALELALIREVPAEVRAISYFTNLIFMSSFFGLGIGCMLERARSYAWLLPLGLGAVATFVFATRGLVIYDGSQAVHYWLQHDVPQGTAANLPLFPAALLAFCVCALPFVALGQRLACSMNELPRLHAYGWDIFGSLAGTLVFVAASALRVPPFIWPPLLMLLLSLMLVRSWSSRALHVGAGMLFLLLSHSQYPAQWSPYYYVQHQTEDVGERVWVNSSFHQLAVNLSPRDPSLAGPSEVHEGQVRHSV